MTYNYKKYLDVARKALSDNGLAFLHNFEFKYLNFHSFIKNEANINTFVEVTKGNPECYFSDKFRITSGAKGKYACMATSLLGKDLFVRPYVEGGRVGMLINGNSETLQLLACSGANQTLLSRYENEDALYLLEGINSQKIETVQKEHIKDRELYGYRIAFNDDNIAAIDSNVRKALPLLREEHNFRKKFDKTPVYNEVVANTKFEHFCGIIFSEDTKKREFYFETYKNHIGKKTLFIMPSVHYARNYIEAFALKAHMSEQYGVDYPLVCYEAAAEKPEEKFRQMETNKDFFNKMCEVVKDNFVEAGISESNFDLQETIKLARKGFLMQKLHAELGEIIENTKDKAR